MSRLFRRVASFNFNLSLSAAASVVAILGAGASLAATPAQAASPWWGLNTSVRPATIPNGGEGVLVAYASNLGNETTSGPSALSLDLPPNISVVEDQGTPDVRFFAFSRKGSDFAPLCSVNGQRVTCTTEPDEAFFEKLFSEPPFNHPPFNEPPRRELIEAAKRNELTIPPIAPYEFIELRVKVKDEGAGAEATYGAEITGGGAATLSHSRPLPLGANPPAFGAESYELRPEKEGGELDPRAGIHPYQLTTTFNLNQKREFKETEGKDLVEGVALPRNLAFSLPPGQIGNAAALPQCSALAFSTFHSFTNSCPPDTAIGAATVTTSESRSLGLSSFPVPLFNLKPAFGEPARFGFLAGPVPVTLDTSLRSGPGEDYGVTVSSSNITQIANLISSTVTFWGTPGDPSHDESRGWSCLVSGHWGANSQGFWGPCEPEGQKSPAAFLTSPTNCNAPFLTTSSGESWTDPQLHPVASTFGPFSYSLAEGGVPQPLIACNQLPFDPRIHAESTNDAATSPTGLGFDINFEDEGLLSSKPGARAQSQLKKAVVTLPQGFTTNPSVAEGLKACSEAEYEAATLEANSGCTPESKVGEVTVQSPLVQPNQIVKGGIYVAKQHDNPNGNLLTLYMIVREPEIGVLIKQALKVEADPVTGQLTTEVDNVPQLPFSHFHLFFRPGQRAPLVTPPSCDSDPSTPGDQPYTVQADLYPWSNPSAPVHRESSFLITSGPEGQGCPSGGVPPFHPNLLAGSENPTAGAYSPFYTEITRRDSEQEITRFSIKLPPGVIGKLAGVSSCSDAAVAAAKAREKEGGGQEELNSPSCPANSEIGHSNVGSGVGNVLAYAPGKLYLAGPYHGSPISIVSITAAKVGPFDLGTVVVRFALRINPETAEVFVDSQGSDPIPHIVDGIPVHLRDIQAFVDRPNFTLNPTSCAKTSTASTVLGSGLDFASEADDQPVTITSPFQVGSCASLGFKPALKLNLKGGTKRGSNPALRAVLAPRPGDANSSSVSVQLPHSEFLDQSHIRTVCTRVQFAAGGGNGEQCPAGAVYGHARAFTPLIGQPLEGPVFLRSSEHPLPDLVLAMHGLIDVDAVGRIDSVNGGIRNTFDFVPDAPVSKVVVSFEGGKKGLLVNSTDLCKGKHRAIVDFTGHNGKTHNIKPVLQAKCGKGKKHHGHRGKR